MAINLVKFDSEHSVQTISLEGTNGTTYSVEFTGNGAKYFSANPASGTFDESANVEITITFAGPEATEELQSIGAVLEYTIGSNEPVGITLEAEVAAINAGEPTTPEPTNGDPEGTEEEEKEVNDFLSRKDVNGEVIEVFKEDYWPVDMLNVEPDKFAIMPGEGVALDCMFGDASIPAAEPTNPEP